MRVRGQDDASMDATGEDGAFMGATGEGGAFHFHVLDKGSNDNHWF